tara:strand:+ start:63999 stop:65864 length:1866 start_codon:yes stop_codon:yes gene_type:complete
MSLSLQTFAQNLTMPKIFNDHMVLQRNTDVRLWGNASPETSVLIKLGKQEFNTISNSDGYWEVFITPQKAGGPHTLTITAGNKIEFKDVYFGDVWLAGGQSNMEWQIGANIDNMEEELNDANYPEIRFIKIPHDISMMPLNDLRNETSWKVANKENARDFSAVAWFFAKHNHLEKDVPVGIIDDNWGGTPAEAWTPIMRLLTVKGYEQEAAEMLEPGKDWDQIIADNEEVNRIKYERVQDTEDFKIYGAHTMNFDDSEWKEISLPNEKVLRDFVWLRKTFELKEVDDAELSFGNPGKFTVAFVNGKHVYTKIWSDDPEVIKIDKKYLKKGKNVIAVRTVEDWSNDTYFGKTGEMWIKTNGKTIDLEGLWKFSNRVEPPLPATTRYEHKPGALFNSMIKPVAGYTIKGAIWYQGESNVDKNQYYNELFEAMIEEWRNYWKQDDFPFLFVQLANYQQKYDYPTDSGWARLQEAQTQTLSLANTGMAVIVDIGDANDIHPRNKQDVGYRLWQSARHVAFNEDIVYSGPMYRSHVIEGNTIRVSFDHTGSGLIIKNSDKVDGFAIAGKDGVFYWAKATIDGNQIVLRSDNVPEPVYIRYAWADNPDVSLYNKEGLPAVPFRTDDF